MVTFTATIKKFGELGEKTGWTYIEIPAEIAQQLKPDNKQSFRVKGKLDGHSVQQMALMPMGEGAFIMALKADVRKAIGKQKGASVQAQLVADNDEYKINAELMECLADEPDTLAFFQSLAKGHQRYFSNWIDSAKTVATRDKRIAQTVNAMILKQDYGQMIRSLKKNRDELMG